MRGTMKDLNQLRDQEPWPFQGNRGPWNIQWDHPLLYIQDNITHFLGYTSLVSFLHFNRSTLRQWRKYLENNQKAPGRDRSYCDRRETDASQA